MTSALPGHTSRWKALFGENAEAPLRTQAEKHPMLAQTLKDMSVQQTQPVIVTMCAVNGIEKLEHDMYHVEHHDVLRKVVADKRAGTLVLHSTHTFAKENKMLRAKKSAISNFTRIGEEKNEDAVANTMLNAFMEVLSLSRDDIEMQWVCAHRWGAAFPSNCGISQRFFPDMGLYLAGDFAVECKTSNYVERAGQSGCDAADAFLEKVSA